MRSLATDERTANAFEAMTRRAQVDGNLGSLEPQGQPGDLLLGSLGVAERVTWLGWSVALISDAAAQWWVVALTETRLLGVAPGMTTGAPTWQLARGEWHAVQDAVDLILTFEGWPELRVLGAGFTGGNTLFGAEPVLVSAGAPQQTSAAFASSTPDESVHRADEEAVAGPSATSPVASWQAAEALAAWHMRELDFVDADVTGAGVDGGIDVTATNAVAQVKHYSKAPIGAPAVQRLMGAALGTQWVLFYAWSGYTKAAIDFADAANVALFRYDESATVTGVNQVARFLLRSRDVDMAARPERFELEQAAQILAGQYFDAAIEAFLTATRQVEPATGTEASTGLVAAVEVELNRVQAICHELERGRVDLDIFMGLVDEINDARRRVENDIARA